MNLRQYYDRSAELHLRNPWYREQVQRYVIDACASDTSSDITTKKIVAKKLRCQAIIQPKHPGCIVGLEEIDLLLRDYDIVRKKMRLFGKARNLLQIERTMLNTLQRLSGIATLTRQLVSKVGRYPLIAATRKTQWGALDKRAVASGGGYTNRLGLFDGVLVKDNHLALTDHTTLQRVHWGKQPAALEVSSVSQLKRAVIYYPQFQILLLDNFSSEKVKSIVRWLVQQKLRKKYILEASGGITPENILPYARSGVDVLSLGYLTHSAPALDISLDIIP